MRHTKSYRITLALARNSYEHFSFMSMLLFLHTVFVLYLYIGVGYFSRKFPCIVT